MEDKIQLREILAVWRGVIFCFVGIRIAHWGLSVSIVVKKDTVSLGIKIVELTAFNRPKKQSNHQSEKQ